MKTQLVPETPGKFSTYFALGSFSIGTILLLLHLQFPETIIILFMGYLFVLAAVTVNSIILLYLLYLLAVRWFDKETIFIRILILLSNIPIALFYLDIVLKNNLF